MRIILDESIWKYYIYEHTLISSLRRVMCIEFEYTINKMYSIIYHVSYIWQKCYECDVEALTYIELSPIWQLGIGY